MMTTGLQLCMDGIPAFSFAKDVSLKPVEFFNFSLPPAVRGKMENILLLMLMPSGLKGQAQKKYFDFAAKFELHELYHKGIDGVKCKVFATSIDTPGRAELLGKCGFRLAPYTTIPTSMYVINTTTILTTTATTTLPSPWWA